MSDADAYLKGYEDGRRSRDDDVAFVEEQAEGWYRTAIGLAVDAARRERS